jgi:hypothetical protein
MIRKRTRMQNQGVPPVFWMIRDISTDTEYLTKHDLRIPQYPIAECNTCMAMAWYRSCELAATHLSQEHFRTSAGAFSSNEESSTEILKHWIDEYNPTNDRPQSEARAVIIADLSNYLDSIWQDIQTIQEGVNVENADLPLQYRLPRSLVDGFQEHIMVFVYASLAIELTQNKFGGWRNPGQAPTRADYDSQLVRARDQLLAANERAGTAIRRGKFDIMLMTGTQDFTQSVSYQAVGPEFVLAMVLRNLHTGVDCKDIDEIYDDYTNSLVRIISYIMNPQSRFYSQLK